MHLERILKLLTILQIITLCQNSHVQQAIRAEVVGISGTWPGPGPGAGSWPPPPPPRKYQHQHTHHNHHNHQQQQRHHRWPAGQRMQHQNRWSGRRKSFEQQQHFTAWTTWTGCGSDCVKRRERFCRVKRKCGHTKQLEEHQCWGCHPAPVSPAAAAVAPHLSFSHSQPQQIVINAAPHAGPQQQSQPPVVHQIRLPVLQEESVRGSSQQRAVSDSRQLTGLSHDENDDFYIINTRPKYKKKRKPIFIDVDDYEELEAEEVEDELDTWHERTASRPLLKKFAGPVHSIRTHRAPSRPSPSTHKVAQRNLGTVDDDDGIEGDVFQYEDFDFEAEVGRSDADQYADSYESDGDYGGAYFRNASVAKERATPNALIPKHRRIYSKWSRWTKCSPKCTTRRYKKCRIREQCGREVLREIAYCYTEGSFCQQWLQAQVQKTPPYDLRPVAASRRREIGAGDYPQSNAIVSDFIMNGKGYRGPEYTPIKLKCGTAPIRSHKRNMYNMLKIIGGKAARKGEWPWQVAIFNRFKEAFCGGTLIAPQWVLTAAHCVRKVLYVRLGEHNLDHEDGTELQLRVLRSYKHPNFDKKTVDSDVALLRLPKPANTTTWIGFSCLPRPYQPLPKNMDCTVIGWGKRRNRDVAGTSVLHQAEVPIIPMDNCRSVYHDYTITKNMFCAGHKRGRIDTCAGDSGGPLLCRDTTKPNHPWTIFGITSFGDGCAKRNKFGIYAKVPNYVDWAWSVINCNGNCKLHQRGYGGD